MEQKGDKYSLPGSRMYAWNYIRRMRKQGAKDDSLAAYQLTQIGSEHPLMGYLDLGEEDMPFGKSEHPMHSSDSNTYDDYNKIIKVAAAVDSVKLETLQSTSLGKQLIEPLNTSDEFDSAIAVAASISMLEINEFDNPDIGKEAVTVSEPDSSTIPVVLLASSISKLDVAALMQSRVTESAGNANWIEDWKEEFYTERSRGRQREMNREEHMYEVVEPIELKTNDIIKDMPQSKFLSWLKDKEAQRQGYSKLKEEENKKQASPKEKQSKSSKKSKSSKPISKKKKKKKLKKILKKSLEIEDEIVSETLAKIMAQQGHTEKAIEMYQKLRLIFPEKSGYFAQIIEKLED